MSDISELDLQNLRHLIGGFDTTHCKMQEYAKEAAGAGAPPHPAEASGRKPLPLPRAARPSFAPA